MKNVVLCAIYPYLWVFLVQLCDFVGVASFVDFAQKYEKNKIIWLKTINLKYVCSSKKLIKN